MWHVCCASLTPSISVTNGINISGEEEMAMEGGEACLLIPTSVSGRDVLIYNLELWNCCLRFLGVGGGGGGGGYGMICYSFLWIYIAHLSTLTSYSRLSWNYGILWGGGGGVEVSAIQALSCRSQVETLSITEQLSQTVWWACWVGMGHSFINSFSGGSPL